MKTAAGSLMMANAALFFFGAVQHVGFVIGPFHEPHILPAAIVESICGLCLLWGAAAIFRQSKRHWLTALLTALIANVVALAGVMLGMVALALGRGPRTASNDLYHRIMLTLIGGAVLFLVFARNRVRSA